MLAGGAIGRGLSQQCYPGTTTRGGRPVPAGLARARPAPTRPDPIGLAPLEPDPIPIGQKKRRPEGRPKFSGFRFYA